MAFWDGSQVAAANEWHDWWNGEHAAIDAKNQRAASLEGDIAYVREANMFLALMEHLAFEQVAALSPGHPILRPEELSKFEEAGLSAARSVLAVNATGDIMGVMRSVSNAIPLPAPAPAPVAQASAQRELRAEDIPNLDRLRAFVKELEDKFPGDLINSPEANEYMRQHRPLG